MFCTDKIQTAVPLVWFVFYAIGKTIRKTNVLVIPFIGDNHLYSKKDSHGTVLLTNIII